MNKVLRSLSAVHRMETSNAISTMLQKIPEYTSAKSVAVFLSMKTEVDTVPIVQYCSSQDKKLLVPKIISDCEYAQYSPSSSGQMTEIYNGAVKMLSKFESLIKK